MRGLDYRCDLRNIQPMKDIDLALVLKSRGMRLKDLASMMGVNRSATTRWAKGRVPPDKVIEVARIAGLSCHDIRPDIFPATDSPPNGAAQ